MIQLGDIILTRCGEKSQLIILGQRLARMTTNANYSHALLSLGGGLWIHADPPDVHLVTTSETNLALLAAASNAGGPRAILALRHPLVDNVLHGGAPNVLGEGKVEAALASKLYTAALYHLGMPYKLQPIFKNRNPQSLFCSELVAKIFADIEKPLNDQAPWHIFPADIEKLAASGVLTDITDQAVEYFRSYNRWAVALDHDLAKIARDAMVKASQLGLGWTLSLQISQIKEEYAKFVASPETGQDGIAHDKKLKDVLRRLDELGQRNWTVSKKVRAAKRWVQRKAQTVRKRRGSVQCVE